MWLLELLSVLPDARAASASSTATDAFFDFDSDSSLIKVLDMLTVGDPKSEWTQDLMLGPKNQTLKDPNNPRKYNSFQTFFLHLLFYSPSSSDVIKIFSSFPTRRRLGYCGRARFPREKYFRISRIMPFGGFHLSPLSTRLICNRIKNNKNKYSVAFECFYRTIAFSIVVFLFGAFFLNIMREDSRAVSSSVVKAGNIVEMEHPFVCGCCRYEDPETVVPFW